MDIRSCSRLRFQRLRGSYRPVRGSSMSRVGLLLPLGLLAACKVDNGLNTEHDDDADVAIMVVDPGFLEFGGLGTGETAVQSFEIRNEGGIPLEITEVRVEGA